MLRLTDNKISKQREGEKDLLFDYYIQNGKINNKEFYFEIQ